MLSWRAVLSAAFVAVVATSAAHGHVVKYAAILNGSSEVTPNSSAGIGTALVTLDLDLVTMRVETSFSGLEGNVTDAHIHALTANTQTGAADVATQVPTFAGFPTGVKAGSYDQTFDLALASSYNPAFISASGGTVSLALNNLVTGLDAGKAYLNIHTSSYPAGEIRGFLINLPGDFNHDLVVDAADYVVWRALRGQTGEGLDPDTNNDNVIDDADYAVWQQNFGQAGLVSGRGSLAEVPELPAMNVLVLGLGLLLTRVHRQQRLRHFG